MYALVWTPTFKRAAKRFLKQHRDLVGDFDLCVHKLERDPHDPALRLHPLRGKLEGKHAVSVTYAYRIVLRLELLDNEIILHDIGSHDDVYM